MFPHNRYMTEPVTKARTIVTDDGVPIDAVHLPGQGGLGIVLAHGFAQSWQRPGVWKVATGLNRAAGVVTFDFRGHGRSGGVSTLGDLEVRDVDVAVAYARELGYQQIATVGFSMGGSIVLRHAALRGGVDAVVSVSGPGRWYYRGTLPMRRVHWAVEHRVGRLVTKRFLKTRIYQGRWDPIPMPPAEAAALIAPIPLLVVHGDRDAFFPVEHAHQLYDAAREPKDLWIEPGFGHAESAATHALLDRIGAWVVAASAGRAEPPSRDRPDRPDRGILTRRS
jgi:pimeloyl-ACP methyl ester carboxylesterase